MEKLIRSAQEAAQTNNVQFALYVCRAVAKLGDGALAEGGKGKTFWLEFIRFLPIAIPFGICVLFLQLLAKIFRISYVEIAVIFNLWIQGAVLAISGILPFAVHIFKLDVPIAAHIGFSLWAALHVVGFRWLLKHYKGTYQEAYDRCVEDELMIARKCHISYELVNIIILIVLYLLVLGLNVWLAFWL